MNNHYDIFLSYRRKGGFQTAKHLFDLLKRDGYRVSFDIDTLREGDFDTALLHRINHCTDFVIILDKEAFSRSIDPTFDRNKDWLRIELAYALQQQKNIIPVMLAGFTDFPDNLPDDIADIRRKNGPKYDNYYFDAFYDRLKEFLHSNAATGHTTNNTPDTDDSVLKIDTDLPCRILVDGNEQGTAQPGTTTRLALRGGSYRLRFVSQENPADFLENNDFRIAKDTEEWYTVALLPIQKEREEREAQEERKHYLMQLDESMFGPTVQNDKTGYKHRETGEILLSCIYDEAYEFRENRASVKRNGKWGFIDTAGNEIIPCIYDKAYNFSKGRARVERNGKYGFIDTAGNEIIPCIYDSDAVSCFFCYPKTKEDRALIKRNRKYGFIDIAGNEIIPCMYDDANDFHANRARVKRNGKYGFIDNAGNEIIPCIYDEAKDFDQFGKARVKKNIIGKLGFWTTIDKNGKKLK